MKKRDYKFWMYVCSLRYLACKARAPCYIVICGLFRILGTRLKTFKLYLLMYFTIFVDICSITQTYAL